MSSFYYGVSNTSRENLAHVAITAAPEVAAASTAAAPSKVADVISAIVPAEALVVYSTVVVPNVTMTGSGGMASIISDSGLFKASIVALAVLSGLLYLAGRLKGGSLNRWDAARVFIPAIAFLCWSGLQTPNGLHLILTGVSATAIVVFGALAGIALAAVAAAIGYKADPASG